MGRDWQERLGCPFTMRGGIRQGEGVGKLNSHWNPQNQWIWGTRVLMNKSSFHSPSLVTQNGTTARPRGLVLQSPLHLLGALGLLPQENLAWQRSGAQLGRMLGTAEWVSLSAPTVPPTVTCPWPSVLAKLTKSCQTSLHVGQTLPLCLFTNRESC